MSYTRTRAVSPGVFATGLGSTGTAVLGYRLYDGATGNANGARIVTSIFEIGTTSGYLANVTHPDLFSGIIAWDDGAGNTAFETINPVEPIDVSHWTETLRAAVMPRGFVVFTGVTNPVSAGIYVADALYNNMPTYVCSATGLKLWYNGAAWVVSAVVGTNGASYFLGGATDISAYAASGTATGTPAAVHKGNSILASYQPDNVLALGDASGNVTVGGYAAGQSPATLLLAAVIDGTMTFVQALRYLMSICGGLSDDNGSEVDFKRLDDNTVAVTFTYDETGRTSRTLGTLT